jgi:hypothetical protein
MRGSVSNSLPHHDPKVRFFQPAPLNLQWRRFFRGGAGRLFPFLLFLALASFPVIADSIGAPAPRAGGDDFAQYAIDHQADLSPFFTNNAGDLFRVIVPMIMGMLGWVILLTMLAGWGLDIILSRCFAYFFAPAFAEVKRSVIYASGRLFLSFVYTGLLGLAIVFSLNFVNAGIIVAVAVAILLVVALGAQLVWILYLYRTNFPIAGAFYLAIIVAHTAIGLLIARPLIGSHASVATTRFIDQAITPRLQAEVASTKQEFARADASRNLTKNKVADLNNQIAQNQADAGQLRAEIEQKKNSDAYFFAQVIQARARGELLLARDQFAAFPTRFPSSSLLTMARAQLAQINDQLALQDTQKKQQAADAALAVAQARADLLARAARGQVTLSEMRQALLGKTRAEVGKLLGLPTETASDSWGYRQQMIVNPLTNEKHGLMVYFSEGTVQGVDYDRNLGTP